MMEKPNIILSRQLHSRRDPAYIYMLYLSSETASLTLTLNEDTLALRGGDVLLFSGTVPLALFPQTSGSPELPPNLVVVSFSPQRMEEFVGPLLLAKNPISRFLFQNMYAYHYEDYLVISTGTDDFLSDLLSSMITEFQGKKQYHESMLNHYFTILMTHLIREHADHCQREITAPISEEGYEIMTDIISSDFRLTLEDIAKAHHIAPSYASRYVKKTTGVAFSYILASARDHVACLMLSTTPKSIRAIAEQVGYDTPENFVRAFKKAHGCTPTEYRKKNEV